MKQGFTYIMANASPTLYIGVTNNLAQQVYQYKNNVVEGFTAKYNVHKLVYFETLESIEQAIIREKQIKDMNRPDKLQLIQKDNSTFKDLYWKILDSSQSSSPE